MQGITVGQCWLSEALVPASLSQSLLEPQAPMSPQSLSVSGISGWDEMVGWHHQLDGHEFEQVPGVSYGQGSLVCCSPWGCKELDTTEQLNWTEPLGLFNWETHRTGASSHSPGLWPVPPRFPTSAVPLTWRWYWRKQLEGQQREDWMRARPFLYFWTISFLREGLFGSNAEKRDPAWQQGAIPRLGDTLLWHPHRPRSRCPQPCLSWGPA